MAELTTPMDAAGPIDDEFYELLTVDVWDTLLRRRCHPDSVKLHVCRHLLLRCEAELPPNWRDAWHLLDARRLAEKQIGENAVRDGLDDEYKVRDVYRAWFENIGLMSFPDGEARESFIEELGHVELEQEKFVSYPDPGIGAMIARRRARRVVFLSDFYMPARAIDALLVHHGIDNLVESGMVSCEVGLNKRSGRLFTHLQEHFHVAPSRHAHIGDNLHADVRAARRLGMQAWQYLPAAEHALRQQRDRAFADRQSGLLAAATLALSPATKVESDSHQQAYDFGRYMAPLLIGFVMFVIERSIADRVDRLLFFTREGEFFIQIYRRLAHRVAPDSQVVRADLLCVSRLSTFAASLADFSPEALMRLWSQYSTQSPRALLRSLGFSVTEFADALERHGVMLDEPVVYPWQNERMLAFATDPEVQALAGDALAAKRESLAAYLASLDLRGEVRRIGIVDVGWRGTIQDNLAHFQPDVFWQGYYLGLNRYLNMQPANVAKAAYGPNLNHADSEAGLLEFVAPIEMLCNSPNGSVTGYRVVGESVQPLRQIDAEENAVHDHYVRSFQKGVLDSVDYWADFIRTHAYSSSEFRILAMLRWDGAIRQPPPFLAEAYFRLNHNEVFGVGGFLDKRRRPGTGQVLAAIFGGKARQRLHGFLNEVGWLPGVLASKESPATFRLSMRLFLALRAFRNALRHRAGQ